MFGINNQQPIAQPTGRVGLRQKYAMKKALKQKQPLAPAPAVSGRKHYIRKYKNAAPVQKPSLFQRIKLAILSRLHALTNKTKMLTSSAPVSSKKTVY